MIKISSQLPKGVLNFAMAMGFEKLSYYAIRSILILYLINGELQLSEEDTSSIYGIFAASIMLCSLLGALLGDLILGNKQSAIIGSCLQASSCFLLIIPNQYCLYLGLGLLSLGSGLFNSNLKAQFARLFLANTSLLNWAIMALMIAITLGSFFAPFISTLFEQTNYKLVFICAGIFSIVSLLFQLKTNQETSDLDYTSAIIRREWKHVGIVILVIFLLTGIDNEMTNITTSKLLDSKQMANSSFLSLFMDGGLPILGIIFSVAFFFLCRYYFINLYGLLRIAILFQSLKIISLLIGQYISPNQLVSSLIVSVFSNVHEVIFYPIFFVLIITYFPTKFAATLLSLSVLISTFIQGPFEHFFIFNSLTIKTELFLFLGILILLQLYFSKVGAKYSEPTLEIEEYKNA
ncbi:MAG: hypothetical protein CFE21_05835 [Bacteroidetes bacterium B1(2017)]|nr:MAG: hypothetical protein CFE21_05835 [Bacteroidetes bacterium B1(2017)]